MRTLRAAILIACVLAAWQALFAFAGASALTSPRDTIAYAAELLSSPGFYPHLIETAQAFAVALAIAISCGILIGFTLGLYRFAADVGEPVLVALYSIPKITLYPIVLLAFGIGMPAKIAFGAIHGIMPIAIFALGAARNLNPVYLKAARVMRLPPSRIAARVLLPAAIPEIFTGIRIGFSLTLIGTLLGEMFASQRGIGHLLIQAIGLHNVRMIMALTLLLVVVAVTASALLLAVDRRLRRHMFGAP
ncbi:MAG: ABC transporter permease subunit [Alphaproteobacteria bacterium]|nr:MAG: ABC transporter permease subunit [Alphaproteobacteria bacterium]